MSWVDEIAAIIPFTADLTPAEASQQGPGLATAIGGAPQAPQGPGLGGFDVEGLLASLAPDTGGMVQEAGGFRDRGAIQRSAFRDVFKAELGRDPRSAQQWLRLGDGTLVERRPDGSLTAGPTVRREGTRIFQGGGPDLTPAQLAEAAAAFADRDARAQTTSPAMVRALAQAASFGTRQPEVAALLTAILDAEGQGEGLPQSKLAEVVGLAGTAAPAQRGQALRALLAQAGKEDEARRDKVQAREDVQAFQREQLATRGQERTEDRAERLAATAQAREDQQAFQAQQNAFQRESLALAREAQMSAKEREQLEQEVREVEAASHEIARRAQRAVETGTPPPDVKAELRSAITRLARPETQRNVAARFGVTLEPELVGVAGADKQARALSSALLGTLGRGGRRGFLGFTGGDESLSLAEVIERAKTLQRVVSSEGSIDALRKASAREGTPTFDVEALKSLAVSLGPKGADDEAQARLLVQAVERLLARLNR